MIGGFLMIYDNVLQLNEVADYTSKLNLKNEIMNTDKTSIENESQPSCLGDVSGSVFIQIGCNYHTKWQKYKAMRFVLKEIKGDKARLITRNSGKDFWTNISDLIFIETGYNKSKANRLSGQ